MWTRRRRRGWRERIANAKVLALGVCAAWVLFSVAIGVELARRAESSDTNWHERIGAASSAVLGMAAAPFEAIATERERESFDRIAADLGVPRIRIHIAPQHEDALDAKRQQALRDGILVSESGDWVPGWLEHDDETVRVELRLKGDWVDHLDARRWSLRIKTRDGALVRGMRTFSLHGVETRGGYGELIFLDEMRAAGIAAPRSFPVTVRLNDRDFGVMVVEEHMAKSLIESSARREGIVLGFDEDVMWRQRREFRRRHGVEAHVGTEYRGVYFSNAASMAVRVFDEGRVWRDDVLRTQAARAIGLLRGYLEDRLPAADVFDLPLWARHRCLVSVWGARHGLASHNLRIYYNPVTELLEPIAFDNNTCGPKLAQSLEWEPVELVPGYDSPIFRAECRRFLEEYESRLAAGHADLLQERSRADREVYATLGEVQAAFPIGQLASRARTLLDTPFPANETVRFDRPLIGTIEPGADPVELLKVYWVETGRGRAALELENPLRTAIVVTEVAWHGARRAESLPGARGTRIAASAHRQTRLRLDVPWSPRRGGSIRVRCHVDGAPDVNAVQTAHRAWPALHAPSDPSEPVADLVARLPRLRFEGGVLEFPPGDYRVDAPVSVPVGIDVRIHAGARFRFGPAARFVVRGALSIDGTPANPVWFDALEVEGWPGLLVLGSASEVAMSSARFRRTAPRDDRVLTGGVTLHRCRAVLDDCRFEDTSCEDALNAIESRVTMRSTTFTGSNSDALDTDFCTVHLAGCHFSDIGGDAVDVSGTELTVDGLEVRDVHDKALSIGERSVATASRVRVVGAGAAIVAKDGSRATVEDVHVRDARTAALMAYIKKPAYGPARITVRGADIADARATARVQFGSSIRIDDHAVAPEAVDVENLYATTMKK